VVTVPELSCGNSFILGNGDSIAVVNMPLEGALVLGPSLHLFDTSPFRCRINGL
jgi:hypothetical protein